MTQFDISNLITPPREEEEVYPYRRVWRSLVLENGLLTLVVGVAFVVTSFLGVSLPPGARLPFALGMALLPLVLWTILSWWAERFAAQPRQRLGAVMLISALVANAIGLPFIEQTITPDRWLPLQSAGQRILAYTLTVGLVQEFLKYLVLRYTVWGDHLRVRLDAVAYGAASAMGYATLLNLTYVLNNPNVLPDALLVQVYATHVMHLVGSTLLAYGLAALRQADAPVLLMPAILVTSALVTGLAIPLRSGLSNAPLAIPFDGTRFDLISATRPFLSLGFSVALLMGPLLALAFLFSAAERRDRERKTEEI